MADYEIRIHVNTSEVERLEAMLASIQNQFGNMQINPNLPGAPGAPGGSTFGGQTGGGNPSAWRANDPAAPRIAEPTVFGQKLSSMSPDVQRAIASADPISAAWMAQQAAVVSPEARKAQAERIRAENRQHRDESYVDKRDFQDHLRQQKDDVRAENRQARDESWLAKAENRQEDKQRRRAVADETRQHRDESWLDRDEAEAARTANRQRLRAENRQHFDESYVDRRDFAEHRQAQREGVRGQNRQAQNERWLAGDDLRSSQQRFAADLSEMNPREQSRAIAQRMQGLDPNSSEFQRLRQRQAALAPQTGLNRTIIPNHMYMQMMFGAFDVAGTINATEQARNQRSAATTVEASLQAQLMAAQGGGGVISSIVSGFWNAGGNLFGFDTPAKLEGDIMQIKSRRQLTEDFSQTLRENRQDASRNNTISGSYAREKTEVESNRENKQAGVKKELDDINMLMSMGVHPEMYADLTSKRKALQQRMGQLDENATRELRAISDRRYNAEEDIRDRSNIAERAAGGASSSELTRMEQDRAFRKELADNPNADMADTIRGRQANDRLALNRQLGSRDEARRITREGAITSQQYRSANKVYEAALSDILSTGAADILQADGPAERTQAQRALISNVVGAAVGFTRDVRRTNIRNTAETAALSYEIAGDPASAVRERLGARMDEELEQIPQGPFRWLVESGIRKRYEKEEERQVKTIQDAKYAQVEGARTQLAVQNDLAQGRDKSAQARSIQFAGLDTADAFGRAGQKDMQMLTLQTAQAQLKVFERQLKISQYTEGSTVEMESGSYSRGGTSTLPKELEPETIAKGLAEVVTSNEAIEKAIRALTEGDD